MVFMSARHAIRAAVELQGRFGEETETNQDLPLRVGIGVDSGEAVQLADGSFRGAALNIAAPALRAGSRRRGAASARRTARLAGRLAGLQFSRPRPRDV